MKKTVEMLREIQYQRLSTTPEVRAMQRLANLPGIDISSSVDFANGLLSAEINAGIVYALRQIVAMGRARADTQDLHRLRTLTPERFYWLKRQFPVPYVRNRSVGVDALSSRYGIWTDTQPCRCIRSGCRR